MVSMEQAFVCLNCLKNISSYFFTFPEGWFDGFLGETYESSPHYLVILDMRHLEMTQLGKDSIAEWQRSHFSSCRPGFKSWCPQTRSKVFEHNEVSRRNLNPKTLVSLPSTSTSLAARAQLFEKVMVIQEKEGDVKEYCICLRITVQNWNKVCVHVPRFV